MADDDDDETHDVSPTPSNAFLGHGGFSFRVQPSTLAQGFTVADDHTYESISDNETTSESTKKRESRENSEDLETGTAGRDETAHNERNDLRISQPKYSQLLKELDFSQTRMVDVTDFLSIEIDQFEGYVSPDDNENPKKASGDDKYQSVSSSRSSLSIDQAGDQQTVSTTGPHRTDQGLDETGHFAGAVNEIENDLNNLAAIIQQASQISAENKSKNEQENSDNDPRKRHMLDEDDDTSRQATQNYDLLDHEPEDVLPSSKASKIPRVIADRSNSPRKKNKTTMAPVNNVTSSADSTIQDRPDKDDEQHQTITWDNLINDDAAVSRESVFSEPMMDQHRTPTKVSHPSLSAEHQFHQRINPLLPQNPHQHFRRIPTSSSSSSSSDTDSVIEHELPRTKPKQATYSSSSSLTLPPSMGKISASAVPPQPLRQDSQGTLIDENLDDLSSQLKQVLLDQQPRVFNATNKPGPSTTSDRRLHDAFNQVHFRRTLNQQADDIHGQTFDVPDHSTSPKKRSHRQHQRHSMPRSVHHNDEAPGRRTDDNWVATLQKLEHEHRVRLERQQQHYEDCMHDLEEKMKRRFDDYIAFTNGQHDPRVQTYDDAMESHLERYKAYHRSLDHDLISRYYPADSTLNVLSSEQRRSTITDCLPSSQLRENITNIRGELSARHAKHIVDLKAHYEHQINQLKSHSNRSRLRRSSGSTRQSMEAIERINHENVCLHDQVNDLCHSLKIIDEENLLVKRQLEELREQVASKDLDLRNYHRAIVDLEQQLHEADNMKERQNEKYRHADRQALLFREENERIKTDLTLTRERLLRLEERYREQENENSTLRRQLFMTDADPSRLANRKTDSVHLGSTTVLPSRDFERFTLPLSAQITVKDTNTDSTRYRYGADTKFLHVPSPRLMARFSDPQIERTDFSQSYLSSSSPHYSSRKVSPNRRPFDSTRRRYSTDRTTKQSEQLERKFDQLLKKKRDLEARLHRLPAHKLSSTDRQLSSVLGREIERVEQQASGVKLELRRLNVFRTHHN